MSGLDKTRKLSCIAAVEIHLGQMTTESVDFSSSMIEITMERYNLMTFYCFIGQLLAEETKQAL